MMPKRARLTAIERICLVAFTAAAAVLRLWLHDVTRFSPADESIYTSLSARLWSAGFFREYASMANEWLTNPAWWRYPNPLRCGYLALTTIAVAINGTPDPRALAWVSTIAGILCVPLAFLFARRVAGTRTAPLASLFVLVSPLQLALGRRALQEEVLCAATLVALIAVLWTTDAPRSWRRVAVAAGAIALALSMKETFLLLYPALALFIVIASRSWRVTLQRAVLLAAPIAAWWSVLSMLSRDPMMPLKTIRLVASAMASRYVVQYQSGPPHRLLFDFLALSPLVTLSACAAVLFVFTRRSVVSPEVRGTAAFAFAGLAAFSLLSSMNLRFVVMLDPVIRLLAAWAVLHIGTAAVRLRTVIAIALANAAIELELFHRVFIDETVYDPVTQAILDSLGAVPRDATTAPPPMLWPWVCAAIAGIAVLLRARRRQHHPALRSAPDALGHR